MNRFFLSLSFSLSLSFLVTSLSSCSHLQSLQKGLTLKGERPSKDFFHPVWIKNLDTHYDTGNLPVGLQGPTVSQGILYIGNNNGPMEAYDLNDGRSVWRKRDQGSSYHSAPLVFKQLLIYGNVEGRLFARDRLSGKLIYNVDLGGGIEERPTYYKGRLVVHTRNHKLVCLDALTGKILWAYKRAIPFLTTLQRVGRPLIHENRIYVGFADGTVGAFTLEEGLLLWEKKIIEGPKFIDVDTSPVLYKNKLLVGSLSGDLSLLDLKTGTLLRRMPYRVARSPLIVDGGILLADSKGEVILLDENMDVKKKIKVSSFGLTSLVQWKGHYVVGTTHGELLAVKTSLSHFEKRDSFHFGNGHSSVFADLIVEDGLLAAYSSRNRLYVFQ